jgi:translation initiation factor IF-2
VDIDQKGLNKNIVFPQKIFKRMEINHPKRLKPKIRGCKVRSGVYWQGALKPNGVNQMNVKNAYIYLW